VRPWPEADRKFISEMLNKTSEDYRFSVAESGEVGPEARSPGPGFTRVCGMTLTYGLV
jgi:hypothetical protein